MRFFKQTGDTYGEVATSQFFGGVKPEILAGALEQSQADDQTTALRAFRERWRQGPS